MLHVNIKIFTYLYMFQEKCFEFSVYMIFFNSLQP